MSESSCSTCCFQLTLVRHGETEYNRLRVIQGQKDVALSDTGSQQAELVAERLAGETFHLAFSSDLSRAKKTALTIASKLQHNMDIKMDTLLRERNLGEAEDRTLSDLAESARRCGLSMIEYTPRGAETHRQLITRAKVFFNNLIRDCYPLIKSSAPLVPTSGEHSILATFRRQYPGNHVPPPSLHVLVTSHGGWIRSFLEHIMEECPNVSLPSNALGISPNTGVTSLLVSLTKSSPPQDEQVLCTAVTSLCMHDGSHL